jgi:amidase
MTGTSTSDLLDKTSGALVDALAGRRISSLELTEALIARIEDRDREINAVVVRDFDRARQAARAADARLARGERLPLLGLPMTVKESNQVEGLPSTWGAPAFSGWIAPEDAEAVQRLKAAGAVIVGLTNVPPMLADWQSTNPVYGRTSNPWDPSRSPGGSSGGAAAALSAGMTPLELGSDIGGSIRVPSALCGVFGHKPTYGLVPTRGHTPPGTDGVPVPLAVVGPMARCTADLERALGVLAGPGSDEASGMAFTLAPAPRKALADYRVLVITEHPLTPTDEEIAGAVDNLARRLEALGAAVSRSSDLLPDLSAQHAVYQPLLNIAISRGAPGATPPDAHACMDLLDAQLAFRRRWAALFEAFDVVITPTFGVTAFPHEDGPETYARTLRVNGSDTPYYAQLGWPAVALLPNLPATALPIGLSRQGLPMGAQVIGGWMQDLATIRFAGLLEQEFGGFIPPPARRQG